MCVSNGIRSLISAACLRQLEILDLKKYSNLSDYGLHPFREELVYFGL